MEIKVLGQLEAMVNGRSVTPTAAKPRQVLALLALRVGQLVSVPVLIEELWGDRPPPSVRTTLQTYILQLRRLIDSALPASAPRGAKGILVTRFEGYLLDISPDDVDVQSYDQLVRAGNRAMDVGDHEAATRLLGMGLAVWRGQALVDVRTGTRLSIEVTRLDESRLCVLETRIKADLRLGRHQALLSELAVLTAQHPMNENLCAHFMIALYRSGRQGQALGAYKTLRDTLVDELSVEPSARLRDLQHSILASDPALDPAESRNLQELLA